MHRAYKADIPITKWFVKSNVYCANRTLLFFNKGLYDKWSQLRNTMETWLGNCTFAVDKLHAAKCGPSTACQPPMSQSLNFRMPACDAGGVACGHDHEPGTSAGQPRGGGLWGQFAIVYLNFN